MDHLRSPTPALYVPYPWLVGLSASVEVLRLGHRCGQRGLRRVYPRCQEASALGGLIWGECDCFVSRAVMGKENRV